MPLCAIETAFQSSNKFLLPIESIILPKANEQAMDDVPAAVLDELEIILVERMEEVIKNALEEKRPLSGRQANEEDAIALA